MEKLKAHKLLLLTLILLGLFGALAFSNYLIKGESRTENKNETKVEETASEDSNTEGVTVEEGNNSAKVKVENEVNSGASGSGAIGTCTVTKNGVTTVVPANEVKINEKSDEDINVKIDCDNSYQSNNGNSSNKATIKNDVKINVSTSNN